ncbi:hypothetical protein [Glaciihabitans arcticus]|uniref:hypothetical protein n=1 Tax=Glaciihabitans arcticus TaxID=2668039 RepID=UPI0012AC0D0D|nr:hypothetical protein [Glaciihabitans arcticus]
MTTDLREGTTAGIRADYAPRANAHRLRAFAVAVVLSLALWAAIGWAILQLLDR